MFKSLKTKIILVLFIISILPVATLFYLMTNMAVTVLSGEKLKVFELSSEHNAMLINDFIDDRLTEMKFLSKNIILRNASSSEEDISIEIKQAIEAYSAYDDITLIDLDGNIIISSTYNNRGKWNEKDWYKQALGGVIVVSDAHMILNSHKVVIEIVVPVFNSNNKLIRILASQIDVAELEKIFFFEDKKEGNLTYIVNNNNKIVLHPDKDLVFEKDSQENNCQPFSKVRETGKDFILEIASPVLSSQIYNNEGCWVVYTNVVDRSINRIVDDVKLNFLYVFMGVTLILFVTSFVVSKIIVKPLMILQKEVKKISEGSLDIEIDINSNDEVGKLARAVNKIVEYLKKSNKEVADRTKQLENSKKELEEKVEQYEKMNKITIDREIKMMELKKKISDLEKLRNK